MTVQTTSVRPVAVTRGRITLDGDLGVPLGSSGLVIFAHGSGSSRHSVRNRAVAQVLRDAGLATLLVDLLTPDEERFDRATAQLRFDIDLLAERLGRATEWALSDPGTRGLRIGLFGASTGAAAALLTASRYRRDVGAVVSRGGRPDLAGPALPLVTAPVLLLVGGRDPSVLRLNQSAAERLGGPHRLVVIPGATHLFEEPGTLEEVARLASDWFVQHLVELPVAPA